MCSGARMTADARTEDMKRLGRGVSICEKKAPPDETGYTVGQQLGATRCGSRQKSSRSRSADLENKSYLKLDF